VVENIRQGRTTTAYEHPQPYCMLIRKTSLSRHDSYILFLIQRLVYELVGPFVFIAWDMGHFPFLKLPERINDLVKQRLQQVAPDPILAVNLPDKQLTVTEYHKVLCPEVFRGLNRPAETGVLSNVVGIFAEEIGLCA
jgi:hypothetical protein